MSDQTGEAEVEVLDDAAESRYEIVVDGTLAGIIAYRDPEPGVRNLVHTEVFDEYEGQGLAGIMAKAALDDIREKGGKVVPSCPYVASYIEKHPDYADLVA